jgi:hypothetical protein
MALTDGHSAPSISVLQFSCHRVELVSRVPRTFPIAGETVGHFQLSLVLDGDTLHNSDAQWATVKLAYLGEGARDLDTKLPSGDYLLTVTGLDDHSHVSSSEHAAIFTVIRTEPVSSSCPAYERFDLRNSFAFAPGRYRLVAWRYLTEGEGATVDGMIRSNEVIFSVEP